MNAFWHRLRDWIRRDRLGAEVEEELQFHRAMLERDQRALGLGSEAAALAARRRLGNRTRLAEDLRAVWSVPWLEETLQDVRYAVRSLIRTPLFALVAVVTLALGVAANTAVFTVTHGVLLRPLPFRDPNALLLVSYGPRSLPPWGSPGLFTADYEGFRRATRAFESVTTFNGAQVTLTGHGDPLRLSAAQVSVEFFRVLGVSPAMGRAFTPEEGENGGARVAILSERLWRSRFGADSSILGATIVVDGNRFVVVGVMSAAFGFPEGVEAWFPADLRYSEHLVRLRPVIGRLRPGMRREQAEAELSTMAGGLFGYLPGTPREDRDARAWPLRHLLVGNVERSVKVFAGAVAFVLLIACANVANLMLMRSAGRGHEMALRTALGAGRQRLVRLLLTESIVVSLAGAAAGVLPAVAGVRALLRLAPAGTIPRAAEVRVDATVLGVTFALALLTGLAFGLAPAFHGVRRAQEALREGTRTTPTRGRARAALVIAEVALAMVLLTGAGLMLKSFRHLLAVDLGFRPGGVMSLTVDLPETRYRDASAMRQFHDRALADLARLPQTLAAAAVNWRPLSNAQVSGSFSLEGAPQPNWVVSKPAVSPDYFRAMGIPIVAGRWFTPQDDARAPGVAIVSQSVARRLWPAENAIGKRVSMEDHPGATDWLTVVGVANDVRQLRLTDERTPAIYQPYAQVTGTFFLSHMTFVARTSADPRVIAPAMAAVVRRLDPDLPAQALASLAALVAETRAEPLFQTRLLVTFSVLALLLAATGIYGVLAYAVAERKHEMGIRMALGAAPRAVIGLILGRTLSLAAAGVALGVIGALAVTRVLLRFLFGVSPTDPGTVLGAITLLTAAALVAGLAPAWRASRGDPLIALRHE